MSAAAAGTVRAQTWWSRRRGGWWRICTALRASASQTSSSWYVMFLDTVLSTHDSRPLAWFLCFRFFPEGAPRCQPVPVKPLATSEIVLN